MNSMDSADATGLQATLFDFSIAELVRQHRESFQPLWTAESLSLYTHLTLPTSDLV